MSARVNKPPRSAIPLIDEGVAANGDDVRQASELKALIENQRIGALDLVILTKGDDGSIAGPELRTR